MSIPSHADSGADEADSPSRRTFMAATAAGITVAAVPSADTLPVSGSLDAPERDLWAEAREVIADGELGRVKWCTAIFNMPLVSADHGAFLSLNADCVTGALERIYYLLPPQLPVLVSAAGRDRRDSNHNLLASLHYERRTIVTLKGLPAWERRPYVIVHGDGGGVAVSDNDLRRWDKRMRRRDETAPADGAARSTPDAGVSDLAWERYREIVLRMIERAYREGITVEYDAAFDVIHRSLPLA